MILNYLDDESDVCDYDLDDEDERWLNQIPQEYRPSNSAFERGIAFLERSANKKVPTFLEFRAQIFVENETADLVYDYWIDRRLKTKEKLTFLVKTKESSRKHKDPYVAFRPCVEKMTTRKNRANDYQEYLKMLKVRRDLANDLKFWQEVKHEQATKHCWLKQMACIFESQYHSENFEMDQPQPCFDAWDRQEMSLEETSNVTETLSEVNDTETHFDFRRNADSEYFKVRMRNCYEIDVQSNLFLANRCLEYYQRSDRAKVLQDFQRLHETANGSWRKNCHRSKKVEFWRGPTGTRIQTLQRQPRRKHRKIRNT